MKKWQRHLTERDREILRFAGRYRAFTRDMVHERFFEGQGRANAVRVLTRLVRRGLLRRVPFDPPRNYFVPTARGNRTIGFSDFPPRLLTEQSLPVAMAIAWYCVHAKVERFTNREFRETHPELWCPALKSSCYYRKDTAEGRKLGLFLIDRGGTPRRIKGKIGRFVWQRKAIPGFADLIRSRRFQITVLTGLASQQDAIARKLGGKSYRRVKVQTACIEELGELLTYRRA